MNFDLFDILRDKFKLSDNDAKETAMVLERVFDVRSDMATKTDIKDVKDDIKELKDDIKELRTEVKDDIKGINRKLDRLTGILLVAAIGALLAIIFK